MAITFDKKTGTFYLDGKDITYAFFVNKYNCLEHLYFGSTIKHDVLFHIRTTGGISYIVSRPGGWDDDAGTPAIHSYNDIPPEISFFGTGDFREPTVEVKNPEGDRLSELLYVGHEIVGVKPQIKGMPSLDGGQTLIVYLRDPITDFCADLYYTVYDDAPVIARRVVYRNERDTAVDLERAYSFALALPSEEREIISLEGAWAQERQMQKTALNVGVFTVDSKYVNASSHLNPFIAVTTPGATETHGEAYGFSLVYSAAFAFKVQRQSSGHCIISGGINDYGFTWHLKPGEELECPEVIISYSDKGLGQMSRGLHDAMRNHLISKRNVNKSRPIVINNWEGTHFTFNAEKLKAIADGVRDTGIDTFVLDDGWFGVRNNARSGLGDWFINTDKLPGGLKEVIDHVNSLGMKFGLWFEPEMISEDSDIYRAHPEYAITAPNRKNTYGRWQYVMDITKPEVRDYIVNSVNKVLDENNIEYVKWDSNRAVSNIYTDSLPKERQGEFSHRFALALYELCERIIEAHPNVFFEGCASGGGRFDAAILHYFPQIWTSDCSDAEERTRIQYGTSMAYPLSAMSCHVSKVPNNQTKRSVCRKTRADIAHLGATGYELDASDFTDEDRALVREEIAEYKRSEDLILNGDLYRIENPFESNEFSMMVVAKDKSYAELTVYRRVGGCNRKIHIVRPQGLDEKKDYYIPELGVILGGSTIMKVGLVPEYGGQKQYDKTPDFATARYHFEEK